MVGKDLEPRQPSGPGCTRSKPLHAAACEIYCRRLLLAAPAWVITDTCAPLVFYPIPFRRNRLMLSRAHVLIADDHTLVAELCKKLLETELTPVSR
jgi:hypothetical protein